MAQGFFGPPEGIDSKDYILLMEGTTPVSRPERLIGHTLTNGNVDLSDALRITRVELQRGRVRTFTITKRAAEERGRTYTIGFPSGALYTPALAAATRPGCRKTFFMQYLCPSDRRYSHVEILPDAVLDPPVPEGDLITVDDVSPITYTSTLNIPKQDRLYLLGYEKIHTVSGSKSLAAIRFMTAECGTCADVPGLGLFATGGDGSAAATNVLTDNRFSDAASTPTAGGTGNYGTSVFTDGSLIVVGYADELTPAGGTGATTGGIYISNNGGVSFAAVSGITVPIYGVARLGTTLIAVGGTGAGAAKLYYSITEGASWVEYTGTLPATSAFTSVAADNLANAAYIVGEGGKIFRATAPGNTVTLVDISSNLPGSPGVLLKAAVLGENHVMVGGASGYLVESFDSGTSWVTRAIAGSTDVSAIGGDRYRTLVGAGTTLYERSPLTYFDFEAVTLEGGQTVTGNYTDVVSNVDGDFNLVAAVTDDGEVVFGKSFVPNS